MVYTYTYTCYGSEAECVDACWSARGADAVGRRDFILAYAWCGVVWYDLA
jgi:hypothetical protein